MSSYYTPADLLGCLAADLSDVARRVAILPPELQAAAAAVELANITTARDPLSVEVDRVLQVVAGELLTG
jgi:hypothetical protein